MSIKPPTYNPPDNILTIFNPLEFNEITANTGYTSAQLVVLQQNLVANQALINQINNKLGTLGNPIFIGSPTQTIFNTATTTQIYSVALAPGIYILSWNLTWGQYPAFSTYKWTQANITMNNQPNLTNYNYNLTIGSTITAGQVGGSIQLQCYLYSAVAWTFAVNINLTCTPTTTTNQWQTGTVGTQYPAVKVANPNLNSLRLVQILSL